MEQLFAAIILLAASKALSYSCEAMQNTKSICRVLAFGILGGFAPVAFAASQLTLTAVNKLPLARASQTIELSAAQLAMLDAKELNAIHVADSAGKKLLAQAVDTDGDAYRKADIVIFQADFAANETKTFTLTVGPKQTFHRDQFKAFGRFNRERFDDFVWENDRIAHRTYGKGLEACAGEPLTSSTIDIWSKRTARMVVNDWYLADHYHADTGEGADFYSAGRSRGCGGSGLWAADQLWTSKNFVNSRVLANGPIRVMFELDYEAFGVNGLRVSEVKRITLDAGSQLDHFQSFYKSDQLGHLSAGIGLKKVVSEQIEANPERGWLLKWEKVEKNAGNQGLAIIIDPKTFERQTEDKLNHLLLAKVPDNNILSYWAGFCWDKAGQLTDAAAWKRYVDEFAQGVKSPIEVIVK